MAYSKRFEYIIAKTLNFEGGFQNHASDRANYTKSGKLLGTNRGISTIAYEQYLGKEPTLKQIKEITPAKAKEIYYKLFWLPMKGDSLKSDGVAWVIFDSYIATGNLNLIKESINNKDITAANKTDSTDVINKVIEQNIKHRKSLNQKQFINGWVKRLNELRNNALKLAFFKNLAPADIKGNRTRLKKSITQFKYYKNYTDIGKTNKEQTAQIQQGQTHISRQTQYPWRITDKTTKNGKTYTKIKYIINRAEAVNGANPKYTQAWFEANDFEMY